ncbi:MAG: type VI secretion system baseplate subunit TssF [Magnetococcus sp. DMHC-1]
MDDLLEYYNQELTYIRRLAGEFADIHPKVAGRLKLTADVVDDPHVARLIESFAFLTARVRLKMEDEFPELTQGLFSILYPNYLAPLPSVATVQFLPGSTLSTTLTLARGTEIETEEVNGELCRYRTCYPVQLLPLTVIGAKLSGRPLLAPVNPRASHAAGLLRLTLQCAGETPFSQLAADRLRFFLKGQPHEIFPLCELLFNHLLSIAVAQGPGDAQPILLPAEAFRPVGFADDEAILPEDARSFSGYRLLSEYFCYPEKFLFFDIDLSEALMQRRFEKNVDLFFYLDTPVQKLERSITLDHFALNCTPVVNLFAQRAEPIRLTHQPVEYRVVPNARRVGSLEVHSIRSVVATFQDGRSQEYRPFFGISHNTSDEIYWHAARRPVSPGDSATEIFLTLTDRTLNLRAEDETVVSVETLCCNRDLPKNLPFGGGRPFFTLVDRSDAVQALLCLTPPTPTLRTHLGEENRWRLLSHLALNHLSLTGGTDATEALQEIVRLYDFRHTPETQAVIDSILSVRSEHSSARISDGLRSQFCRGVDVVVEFDEKRWSTSGLFLFATILEHFFGTYCAVNSYTRFSVKVRGCAEIVRQWPPRAGERRLL